MFVALLASAGLYYHISMYSGQFENADYHIRYCMGNMSALEYCREQLANQHGQAIPQSRFLHLFALVAADFAPQQFSYLGLRQGITELDIFRDLVGRKLASAPAY